MNPEQILRKKPFTVPIPPGVLGVTPIVNPNIAQAFPLDNVQRELRTQSDFIRQYYPTSHLINHIKYYPNTMYVNRETGAYQAKVRSRIAIGFQERILTKRKEALLGNNVGMKLISDATNQTMIDLLAFFREGWEEKDMEVAVNNAIESDYLTADCAICIYMDEQKVGWRSLP